MRNILTPFFDVIRDFTVAMIAITHLIKASIPSGRRAIESSDRLPMPTWRGRFISSPRTRTTLPGDCS